MQVFLREIRYKLYPIFFFFSGLFSFVCVEFFVLFNYPVFGGVEVLVLREEEEGGYRQLTRFGEEGVG